MEEIISSDVVNELFTTKLVEEQELLAADLPDVPKFDAKLKIIENDQQKEKAEH